jgi:serine/threonine protein kinase
MSELNTCSFILKNYNQCKNKYSKIYNDIPYCTRHYNKLILEFNNSQNNLDECNNKFNIKKISKIILNISKLKNYTNLEYINSGTYVDVYKLIINDKIYALKYQSLHNQKNMLYYEYILLSNHLNNHINILSIYSDQTIYCFKNKEYAILLTEYINLSYNSFISNNIYKNNIINIETIKHIAIQLINAIKYIHQKKYLYIDLKPDNIMFNDNILKLIDFNLCIKYIDIYSNYYSNDKLKSRQGNDIYSSRNINSGFRGVRIDDIESILYILLDILKIDEFITIKQSKQIKVIIEKKKYIFTQNYKYDFINKYITELNKYITNDNIDNKLQNKSINYINFIKCLE